MGPERQDREEARGETRQRRPENARLSKGKDRLQFGLSCHSRLEIRMLPLTVESLMGGPPSPSLPSSFFPISP